jgi:thymidylate kinase
MCPVVFAPEINRSRHDFLCTLFNALDTYQVRYCVLHSWEELPEKLTSDLDIAIHPGDFQKLPVVIRSLRPRSYTPVQVFNYLPGAYSFFFMWSEGLVISSVALDVIFEHRRGGLIVPSGEALVSGRRRQGLFWVPAVGSEFTYLLAKKASKGTAPARQVFRLKTLVEELGRPTAERLAGELFWGKLRTSVVEACATGRLDGLLAKIKKQSWKTSLLRNPLKLAAYLLSDALRRIQRWLQPTGLFVVIMGPDGAGKSTVIQHLVETVAPVFRRHRVFHWRPALLWRRKVVGGTTHPHSRPPYGDWWSIARLLAHLLDYWLGYCVLIRPLLARSGLVVFDRYFYDLLADPKRYRFGGPAWLARFVSWLVPQPDLLFILDAPVEVIFSRKQEVMPDELLSQKLQYLQIARSFSQSRLVDSAIPLPQVVAEIGQTVRNYLARRFENRHAHWLAPDP